MPANSHFPDHDLVPVPEEGLAERSHQVGQGPGLVRGHQDQGQEPDRLQGLELDRDPIPAVPTAARHQA